MRREDIERIVWKVLSGLTPRPEAEDVDLIMSAVDAYTMGLRQRHRMASRPLHYAPMPAIETACGVQVSNVKLIRITGKPADAECVNCIATVRWKRDMALAVEQRRSLG